MQSELITSADLLTPERLTDLLRSGEHLRRGEVVAVRVSRTSDQVISHHAFLNVTYSGNAAPVLPTGMMFKVTNPGLAMRGKEVSFYQHVAQRRVTLPVPRCFSAAYCSETKREHVLLEDLSNTHGAGPKWPALPTPAEMELLVDALADLHAGWWHNSWLIAEQASSLEWEAIMSLYAEDDEWLARMLRSLEDSLPAAQADFFRRVYARFPRVYWQRVQSRQGLTMFHGDAHAWNFLYPSAPGAHVYLVDWQCWGLGLGAQDTAYLIGLRWDQTLRQRHERELLRRYCDRLLAGGITGYEWEDCWQDYRLMCLYNAYFPACFYHKKFGEAGMWQMIQHSIATAENLDCLELLD